MIDGGGARTTLGRAARGLLLSLGLYAADAMAESFRFGWPLPATVAVHAEVDEEGLASTARYVLAAGAATDDEITLEFRDFELLTVNGVSARDPARSREFAPVAALTAALPALRIGRDGSYRGIHGLNLMLERVLALLPSDLDPARRDQFARGLRAPATQARIGQQMGELWNTWVGAWNGLELNAGEVLQGKAPISILGETLEQQLTFEHLGPVAGYPAAVRLRMTTLIEGPAVLALLDRLDDARTYRAASSRNVTEIVTRADGLTPYHAHLETEVVVRDAAGRAERRQVRKTYRFEWPNPP